MTDLNTDQSLETEIKVAVIIPNWNGKRWLDDCLNALYAQTYRNFRIILVDNGSNDGSIEHLQSAHSRVKLISLAENSGFAKASNLGARSAGAEYVAFLNNDTIADPDWLQQLVRLLDQSPDTIVGATSKMIQMNAPHLIDDAGDSLSWYGEARKIGHGEPIDHHNTERRVFSASGGACLIRRAVFERLGGFDEHFFAYLEDVDFGFRVGLSGYGIIFCPTAVVRHHGHGSNIPGALYISLSTRNRLAMMLKCVPLPLFSRNLPALCYGQLYFLIAYGRPIASLRGYWWLLRDFPEIIRARRQIMASRIAANSDVQSMLLDGKPDPKLARLVSLRIQKLVSRLP